MKNTISKKIKNSVLVLAETFVLTGIMLLSIFPVSCRVSLSGLEIIGADCKVPVLENYEILDSKRIKMNFSDSINLISAGISENKESEILPEKIEYPEEDSGKTVIVYLQKETDIGKKYIFTGEVENINGSTLTFSYKFTGYNNKTPNLIFSEIADGSQKKKDYTLYEYIEFYALSEGNLAGLKISSINDGDTSSFNFPSVEIHKGDYVTVHFRKTGNQESLCINETTDISESKSQGSSPSSWDFWIESQDSHLGASQDIILLENTNNNKILQAVCYSIIGKDTWAKEKFSEAAEKCFEENLWFPGGSAEHSIRFKTSASLSRTNLAEIINSYNSGDLEYPFTSSPEEWSRITPSSLTPGY
ncbi:MAG: hypothetical protein MJ182_01605 [Treponema sp.]|nr:hypothetical protein [Treponema sp.]